jgi:ectoine hydroxylase-related dioxygenase (phytanoyl-CoA dioxygenase family)
MLTETHRQFFAANGYVVVPGLFSAAEAEDYIAHYMDLRHQGAWPGDTAGVDIGGDDPIKRYPRMIHMHRWDEHSLRWLIDPRLRACLAGLLGRDPYAVQTMLYFKPAGARGQALHQDNFYLRAHPGTCMAAWMALDACDEANGCMQVVPGSHRWPLLCTETADTHLSFTDITVPIPPGTDVQAVPMQPGDVLFFNGTLIHGSYPNTTPDRFRRALIGHYIEGQAQKVAEFFDPVLRMDGSHLTLDPSDGGGACGVWVDRAGAPVIEMAGLETRNKKHE